MSWSPLLTERRLMMRDSVRRFADERIRPQANPFSLREKGWG